MNRRLQYNCKLEVRNYFTGSMLQWKYSCNNLGKLLWIILIPMQMFISCAQNKNKLGSDDKAVLPNPPLDFATKHYNFPEGTVDSIHYYSATIGCDRKLLIYLPPGFDVLKRYPVLYLLHGIAGDEKEWFRDGNPSIIFDNLIAKKKLSPIIAVFPNGRAMKNDKAEGDAFEPEKIKAFTTFERELLNDLIPFIEENYPAINNNNGRAIAGLSMGAGQSVNIAFDNPDKFGWVGAFSLAGSRPPEKLLKASESISKQLKLIYISCGSDDRYLFVSQGFHKILKRKEINHIYQVDSGGHEMRLWLYNLYRFSQRIFRTDSTSIGRRNRV